MQEGTVLDGRYRLIQPIGAGGFGQVWAAHDPKIDRLVAVKVLTGDASSSRQAARFARDTGLFVALGISVEEDISCRTLPTGSPDHPALPHKRSAGGCATQCAARYAGEYGRY